MTIDKRKKVISIAAFLYSFFMAFSLFYFGKFSLETDLVGIGYFALLTVWLWVILNDENKCSKCPQYGEAIIYPRKCYYEHQCNLPVWFQTWRLKRILHDREKDQA